MLTSVRRHSQCARHVPTREQTHTRRTRHKHDRHSQSARHTDSTCRHAETQTRRLAYVQTSTRTGGLTYRQTQKHKHTRTHSRTYTHKQARTDMQTFTYVGWQTNKHTYRRTPTADMTHSVFPMSMEVTVPMMMWMQMFRGGPDGEQGGRNERSSAPRSQEESRWWINCKTKHMTPSEATPTPPQRGQAGQPQSEAASLQASVGSGNTAASMAAPSGPPQDHSFGASLLLPSQEWPAKGNREAENIIALHNNRMNTNHLFTRTRHHHTHTPTPTRNSNLGWCLKISLCGLGFLTPATHQPHQQHANYTPTAPRLRTNSSPTTHKHSKELHRGV